MKVDMKGFKPVLTDFDSEIPCIKFNLFIFGFEFQVRIFETFSSYSQA